MNRLLALLTSVSDGAPVDWDREEREMADDADRRLVRSLRLVAGMAARREMDTAGDLPANGLAPGRSGSFELLEPIGGGSYGWVWRARDLRLGRLVALKTFDSGDAAASEGGAEWLAEARRLATVRHPNVVAIHSVENLSGTPAIVMELIEGRTLDACIEANGPFGPAEIAAIGSDLCSALAAVHRAGLVHHDVKAQNVMREQGGRIVLMDFSPGGGTPHYMAPELFAGEAPSVASDIYALGVLLAFLATGQFPFEARTLRDLKQAHVDGSRRPLLDLRPDLPLNLARVVEKAMAPDKSQRWKTAGELEQALRNLSASRRAGRPAGRAVGVAAALLALAAAGALIVRGRPPAVTARVEEPRRQGAIAAQAGVAKALPTGHYVVEAAFYRGRRQRDRLEQGDRVAPGDSVSLMVRSSSELHLYVVNEDATGNAFLLYPVLGLAPANPLAANGTVTLPGRRGDEPFYWQVTSTGGREHLMVIASPRPLSELATELSALDQPRPGAAIRFARVRSAALLRLRGFGGLAAEAPEPLTGAPAGEGRRHPSTRRLYELAEPLPDGPDTVSGVWIRRLDLDNPGL